MGAHNSNTNGSNGRKQRVKNTGLGLQTSYPRPLPRPKSLLETPNEEESADFISLNIKNGILCHERKLYEFAAFYFSIAASKGDPTGLFLYAISMRHGWGVEKDEKEALRLLELVTDSVGLVSVPIGSFVHADHIPLALFEIGVSLQQGWGIKKDAEKAAYYFQLAANLDDCEAQVALAECYLRGDGVKRNKQMAAFWFRRAEKNGARLVQMQWIWKEKYSPCT